MDAAAERLASAVESHGCVVRSDPCLGREAATDRLRDDRPDEFDLARSLVRVLFTSYSLHKLLWLVPVGFVVGSLEALGDLGIYSDQPFSLRYRLDGNTLTLKDLKLGIGTKENEMKEIRIILGRYKKKAPAAREDQP